MVILFKYIVSGNCILDLQFILQIYISITFYRFNIGSVLK